MRWLGFVAVVLMLAPSASSAAEAREIVLDFTRPGPMRDYLALTKSVAIDYAPLAVILAVVLEALGRAPGVPRNFAAVFWRVLVVVFLFWNYDRIFGAVISITEDIASRVRPADALAEFHAYMDEAYGAAAANSSAGVSGTPASEPVLGTLTSGLFDAGIGVLLFLAKALVYALERLARILTAVFFIVGPLALVAGIPRPSPTAFAWFRHFVTIASWPIFSGVLLGVMAAVGKQSVGGSSGNYLAALIAATVMGLCALAAPVLSAWIIGGGVQNLAGAGLNTYENVKRGVLGNAGVRAVLGDRRGRGSGHGRRAGDPAQCDPDTGTLPRSGEVAANPPVP